MAGQHIIVNGGGQMDQYIASLARACLEPSGISTFYTEDMPEDFKIPCLYFPPAELSDGVSGLESFEASYDIFAKVFAGTRQEAMELAEAIVRDLMLRRCRISVYKENGDDSGQVLKIRAPAARAIGEGVAQITLGYTLFVPYRQEESQLVQHYYIKNKHYD